MTNTNIWKYLEQEAEAYNGRKMKGNYEEAYIRQEERKEAEPERTKFSTEQRQLRVLTDKDSEIDVITQTDENLVEKWKVNLRVRKNVNSEAIDSEALNSESQKRAQDEAKEWGKEMRQVTRQMPRAKQKITIGWKQFLQRNGKRGVVNI